MRNFIILTAAIGATLAIRQTTAKDAAELREQLDAADGDDKSDRAHMVAIELPDGASVVIPGDDEIAAALDDEGDGIVIVELAEFSQATHEDVAGVVRSAAGRPIDAQPGSMDAALTGMQHDAAGTVRNTVSPEPTHSAVVEAAREADPGIEEQAAPKAQQGTTR